ncbi:MAG: sulfatase [Planctomycetes bacterium]|nr:sulfatase [Planctomycetota bacterium]
MCVVAARRLSALALLILLAVGLAAQAERPSRPNILFALADDWGWPHVGALGDRVVATPTFDRLAKEGVLFEHACVSSPSCTPSRNAILTGQQFYRLGEGANLHSTLDVAQPNFMSLLQAAGYQIGHWRKAWGPGDFKAGGYTSHPCGPGGTFEAFLKQRDPTRPFCFWFGTSDPHRGYRRHSGRDAGIDLGAIRVPSFLPDHEDVRGDIADYYFEVQRWDHEVGEALAALEAAGQLDNTLIVMTGDHGMPFPRCKGNVYDHGVRVPLAMRWNRLTAPGRRLAELVSFTDLAPTFLAAAGLEVPAVMTGNSLLPLLCDDRAAGADPWRDFVVFGRERHTPAQAMPAMVGYPMRGLRTERWLLILNLEPDRWPAGVAAGATHPFGSFADCDDGPTKQLLMRERDDPAIATFYDLCFARRNAIELYDCQQDPDQIHDLAGDDEHAGIRDELRQRLVDYLARTGDPRFTDAPVRFDDYPYRAAYLQQHLEQQGQKQRQKR